MQYATQITAPPLNQGSIILCSSKSLKTEVLRRITSYLEPFNSEVFYMVSMINCLLLMSGQAEVQNCEATSSRLPGRLMVKLEEKSGLMGPTRFLQGLSTQLTHS